MAQETQYCSLRYILGTVYSGNTEASEISPGIELALLSRGCDVVESLADGIASRRGSEGERTDGGRLDHVADGESLDRLVLWSTSGAVGAANWVHVSTSLLVTSTTDGMSVEVLYRLSLSSRRRRGRSRVVYRTWKRAS
jgi:hypothetical protein